MGDSFSHVGVPSPPHCPAERPKLREGKQLSQGHRAQLQNKNWTVPDPQLWPSLTWELAADFSWLSLVQTRAGVVFNQKVPSFCREHGDTCSW